MKAAKRTDLSVFVTCAAVTVLGALSAAGQPPRTGDVFSVNTCDTPARDESRCPKVHWGWGSCPGQPREACDVCYGSDGRPFAYVKRTNRTYRLSSGCEHLSTVPPEDVTWATRDRDTAAHMRAAKGSCEEMRGVFLCQAVSGPDFKQGSQRAKPETGAPSVPSPEEQAAQALREQWNAPKERGKPVGYGRTSFGGDILHGVRVRGKIRVAFSPRPGRTVPQFVAGASAEGQPATGGVTGTFFAPGSLVPAGPVIADGQVVADNRPSHHSQFVPRSFLGCNGSGCFVADLPVDESPAALRRRLDGMVHDDGVQDGLGGLGRLLAGGEIRTSPEQQVDDLSSRTRDARVVAGIDGDGALVLLVQQGDDTAKPSRGANAAQLGKILQALGVVDAVLLDGGGSTQISIPARGVLYEMQKRAQPTAILF
jgi:phosphodiester glycosidase